jgi:hypothetical protein
VIYTPTHQVISSGSSIYLDFLNNGTNQFLLSNHFSSSIIHPQTGNTSIDHAYLHAVGQATQSAAAINQKGWARALPARQRVGAGDTFDNHGAMVSSACEGGAGSGQGPWKNVSHRYLGLRFVIKNKVHYGWARFNISDANCQVTATLTGYAYETMPNKAIIAGRTKGPDVITVSGTLGGLAKGTGIHPKRPSFSK